MMTDTMTDSVAATSGGSDDRLLLERFARDGDQSAFADIVHRYADFVFASCLRVLHDRARAEEVSQETFFKLLRHPHAVEKSLPGWLHRVATRLSIDQLRREGRRKRRELAHEQDKLQRIDSWSELSPHLDEALDALPESSRKLLIEHFLHGRTMREIADDQETSAATACRRTAAALEALRAQLRRRGVLVLAAAMGTLLAQQSAEAAPITLKVSLAKMAILGGAAHSGAAASGGFGLATAAQNLAGKWAIVAAGGTLGLTAAVSVALWLGPLGDAKHGGGDTAVAAKNYSTKVAVEAAATTSPKGPEYLVVPSVRSDLGDSERLQLVQDPVTAGGPEVAIVFADGHLAMLPILEADRRVQQQAKRSLAELARDGKRVILP